MPNTKKRLWWVSQKKDWLRLVLKIAVRRFGYLLDLDVILKYVYFMLKFNFIANKKKHG